MAHLPGQADLALDAALPAGTERIRQYTFLGAGWTIGLANEAALKIREAAQAWAESYPAMEYRHGPISVSDASSLVWFLGDPPPGLEADTANTGATVERSEADPLADLIRVQRMAVAVAEFRGLDPDRPRHLTRSVVLASGDGPKLARSRTSMVYSAPAGLLRPPRSARPSCAATRIRSRVASLTPRL